MNRFTQKKSFILQVKHLKQLEKYKGKKLNAPILSQCVFGQLFPLWTKQIERPNCVEFDALEPVAIPQYQIIEVPIDLLEFDYGRAVVANAQGHSNAVVRGRGNLACQGGTGRDIC